MSYNLDIFMIQFHFSIQNIKKIENHIKFLLPAYYHSKQPKIFAAIQNIFFFAQEPTLL